MIGVAWLGWIDTHTDTSHYNLRENFSYWQQLKVTTTKSLPYSTSCMMIEPMNEHQNKLNHLVFGCFNRLTRVIRSWKVPPFSPSPPPPPQKSQSKQVIDNLCKQKNYFHLETWHLSTSSCCCCSRESPKPLGALNILSALYPTTTTQKHPKPNANHPALTCCCEVSKRQIFFQHVPTRINK